MAKVVLTIVFMILSSLPLVADQSGAIFSWEIRKEAQEALTFYGHDAGTADGIFGPQTVAAIRSYQASIGVQQTGALSRAGMRNLLQRFRMDRLEAATPTEGDSCVTTESEIFDLFYESAGFAANQLTSNLINHPSTDSSHPEGILVRNPKICADLKKR